MTRKLSHNPELVEAIIPKNFAVGCRRPTVRLVPRKVSPFVLLITGMQPGNGFLEALNRENVSVFTQPMKAITPAGFIAQDEQEHEVDVIICATGYGILQKIGFY